MPSVNNIMGLLENLQSMNLGVHQNRCSAVRNRNASCFRCAQACTSGCISYAQNELIIDPSRCIGCGTCATACPTGALYPLAPNDAELLQAAAAAAERADGEAVLACEQMLQAADGLFDPEKVVSVKCLGRVDESLIAALLAAGARRVSLVQGPCDGCEYEKGRQMALTVARNANDLLQAWGIEEAARVRAKLPRCVRKAEGGYDAQKRRMFFSTKDSAKSVATVAADYVVREALDMPDQEEPRLQRVTEDGTLPHFMPPRRALLLDSLGRLGEPADVPVPTRLAGHVEIDLEVCNSCRICAVFCPTGAIAKFDEEDDGTIGIDHAARLCLKCRCCQDVCLKKCLTLSDEVFAADVASGFADRFEMKPRESGFFGPPRDRKKKKS